MRARIWPAAVAAALLGAAFFVWSYGATALDGTSIDWLLSGDRAQSFLGWHFYRHEPETFPLGGIASLLHPVGSSLAYSDALPWFSIVLKPLSPLLPATFQIAGFWLLLAYALQGTFAFLVLHRLLGDRLLAVAGSVLVIASPVLTRRGAHLSLCAQWLVLAAFAATLATGGERRVGRFLRLLLPLLVLAGGTHPYLMAMVLALALAACGNGTPLARLRLRGGPVRSGEARWAKVVVVRAGAVAATAALSLYLFGYLGAVSAGAGGFGSYSANLLALIDPDGESRLLPDLPSLPGGEGHGYLGSGVLLLLAIAAVRRIAAPAPRPTERAALLRIDPAELRLLAIVIAAMALFALGSRITAGSLEVASARGIYGRLEPLPSIFRASGRFLWPLHYAVVLAAIVWLATSVRRRRSAVAIVACAGAFQLWDGASFYRGNDAERSGLANRGRRLASDAWRAAGDDYDEIRLVPPYFHEAECATSSYPPYFYIPFAYQAGRQRMRINSGHLSRQPHAALAAACRHAEDEIAVGHVDPRAVYVVSDAALARFTAARLGLATCGRLAGFNVCLSTARKTRFATMVPVRLQPHLACTDLRARFAPKPKRQLE